MNASPSPSTPPKFVRQGMPVSAMRLRSLPRYSPEELAWAHRYTRKSSRIPRHTSCAPPGSTITPEAGK